MAICECKTPCDDLCWALAIASLAKAEKVTDGVVGVPDWLVKSTSEVARRQCLGLCQCEPPVKIVAS